MYEDLLSFVSDIFVNSTDVKFSQHAVFHIPGAVFRNNIAAGLSSFAEYIYVVLKASCWLLLQTSGQSEDIERVERVYLYMGLTRWLGGVVVRMSDLRRAVMGLNTGHGIAVFF